MTSIQLIFIISIILFIVIYCNESIRFLKYPQHVLITFTLQSQIINHNIYINSSPHDLQWVSYRYHDKRKSPINGLFTPFMKLCLLFKLDFGNYILYLIKLQASIFGIIILKILHILCRFGTFCKHFATMYTIFQFIVYTFILAYLIRLISFVFSCCLEILLLQQELFHI